MTDEELHWQIAFAAIAVVELAQTTWAARGWQPADTKRLLGHANLLLAAATELDSRAQPQPLPEPGR
jgi:hypothetical protein